MMMVTKSELSLLQEIEKRIGGSIYFIPRIESAPDDTGRRRYGWQFCALNELKTIFVSGPLESKIEKNTSPEIQKLQTPIIYDSILRDVKTNDASEPVEHPLKSHWNLDAIFDLPRTEFEKYIQLNPDKELLSFHSDGKKISVIDDTLIGSQDCGISKNFTLLKKPLVQMIRTFKKIKTSKIRIYLMDDLVCIFQYGRHRMIFGLVIPETKQSLL